MAVKKRVLFPQRRYLFVWLVAGADLFWEKSTSGWLLVAGLFWEKSTVSWWLISQTNTALVSVKVSWSTANYRWQYVTCNRYVLTF
jgi:hypothetical protein